MTRSGASLDEWNHWDILLGLTDDLLPVVCEPGLPISPNSQLKSYGKTPSIVLGNGVCGLTAWTRRRTTQEQITAWSEDPRLGICLQTRRIRAIDVDIPDRDAAHAVYQCLSGWFADHEFLEPALRIRADSGKFLLLIELPGDYPKQVLETAAGPIEFLARGNQCLIAGLHKDGARYTWLRGFPSLSRPLILGPPLEIPLFTDEDLRSLQSELRTRFGTKDWTKGRSVKERVPGAATGETDPVVEYLTRKGMVLHATPERVDIICPWSADHTTQTDDSATSVFPAGTGGFECTHLSCLHAHCADKTDGDFLDAIGYTTSGFVDETPKNDMAEVLESFGVTTSEPIAIADSTQPPSPLDRPRYDIDANKGKIKAKMNNVLLWLEYLTQQGQGAGFDLFQDEIVLYTAQGRRAFTDADYTRFRARADRESFMPLSYEMVQHGVRTVAQDHCFDSGAEWIHALPPWDGIERVDTFCTRYLGAPDDPHSRAVGRYLWTAMPGRILHPGIQADMTLVMVSKQGTRKSSMIRVLAPKESWFTTVSFSDKEDDLARLTKGKTLVEIPELKGLRTRENDWIKAFVTKRENSWVPKYFEMQTTYHRRFLMVGTTNDREFLADPTGDRRWLPIDVRQLDDETLQRDHLQLWAEGTDLFFTHGILWQDAQMTSAEVHLDYTIHDILEDQIAAWLDQEDSLTHETPGTRKFLRLLDVWNEVCGGATRLAPRHEQLRIADALTRLGYERRTAYVEKRVQKVWMKAGTRVIHDESGKLVSYKP